MPRPAVLISLSRPARVALLALSLAVIGTLTGCATGFGAQTTTIYTAPAGADVRTGDVKGLNMLVVADGDGGGTLVAALVNTTTEDDELVAMTVTDNDTGDEITVTGLDVPLAVPAGELVQVAAEDTVIGVSGESVLPGQVLRINMQFARAGAVTAEVPVVARDNEYESVPMPPAPESPENAAPTEPPD